VISRSGQKSRSGQSQYSVNKDKTELTVNFENMDFKELIVYKKAFTLAMEVYEVPLNYMMLHP
jgi:hypothetical protein